MRSRGKELTDPISNQADHGLPWWAWLLIGVAVILVVAGAVVGNWWNQNRRGPPRRREDVTTLASREPFSFFWRQWAPTA
ncbi:hypothetical protein AQUCO_01300525v1 [Aquilegia coerulea]|uniref:Uncharacterized protein n=1 Tax=Aquilegia coerulea TaxID=218851 RepID=A0A2G5E245_AQUCA|nr:hypothetical protein AQUCO_01300525v1 [Aquilegia coerulea]